MWRSKGEEPEEVGATSEGKNGKGRGGKKSMEVGECTILDIA